MSGGRSLWFTLLAARVVVGTALGLLLTPVSEVGGIFIGVLLILLLICIQAGERALVQRLSGGEVSRGWGGHFAGSASDVLLTFITIILPPILLSALDADTMAGWIVMGAYTLTLTLAAPAIILACSSLGKVSDDPPADTALPKTRRTGTGVAVGATALVLAGVFSSILRGLRREE